MNMFKIHKMHIILQPILSKYLIKFSIKLQILRQNGPCIFSGKTYCKQWITRVKL